MQDCPIEVDVDEGTGDRVHVYCSRAHANMAGARGNRSGDDCLGSAVCKIEDCIALVYRDPVTRVVSTFGFSRDEDRKGRYLFWHLVALTVYRRAVLLGFVLWKASRQAVVLVMVVVMPLRFFVARGGQGARVLLLRLPPRLAIKLRQDVADARLCGSSEKSEIVKKCRHAGPLPKINGIGLGINSCRHAEPQKP